MAIAEAMDHHRDVLEVMFAADNIDGAVAELQVAAYEQRVFARTQAEALESARIKVKENRECIARDHENEVC